MCQAILVAISSTRYGMHMLDIVTKELQPEPDSS